MNKLSLYLVTSVLACAAYAADLKTERGTNADTQAVDLAATGAPTSGYLLFESYGLDKDKQPRGQKRLYCTWFDSNKTRQDEIIGDSLTSTRVVGELWVAFPAAGRYQQIKPRKPLADAAPVEPFSVSTKKQTEMTIKDGRVIGEETVLGLSCRIYEVHYPGKDKFPPVDIRYWIWNRDEFPLCVRWQNIYEGEPASESILREIKLDCVIPAEVFALPKYLMPVVDVPIPATPFRIDAVEYRQSKHYGWKTKRPFTYVGDGISITETSHVENTNEKGEISVTEPHVETISYNSDEKWRLWPFKKVTAEIGGYTKQVREDVVLGMSAQVLENAVVMDQKTTTWIVDHPVFGTICVKEQREDSGEVNRTEVITIEPSSTDDGI